MKDKTKLVMLLDFYGNMLSPLRREILAEYSEQDMSLSEIAVERGVTRQAIADAVYNGARKLENLEKKLGLVARFEEAKKLLFEIAQCADNKTKGKINKILETL